MPHTRRSFIKSAGGFAIATILPAMPLLSETLQSKGSASPRVRAAFLFDSGLPEGEIKLLSRESYRQALSSYDVEFITADELPRTLKGGTFDLFINPYGSYFPETGWKAIVAFLSAGGNFLNLGGVPFAVPLRKESSGWRAEVRQTQYHKRLGITQGFPVSASGLNFPRESPWDGLAVEEVYELYLRFTSTKDFPMEDGSAGARDADCDAPVYGFDDARRKAAAPLLQIDRMEGDFAGGRWILANYSGSMAAKTIAALAGTAAQGALQFSVRTSFASYREGEKPAITISLRRPKGNVEHFAGNDCRIEITNDRGSAVAKHEVKLKGAGSLATALVDAGSLGISSLAPGLYRVSAALRAPALSEGQSFSLAHTTGFWMYDGSLLKKGAPFTANETYLVNNGRSYPVTGTTYMGSDVHRKFLFEPNPMRWHEDFQGMKKAGINMVRTGIWTAWKNFMLDAGAPEESALRAMDAFVHTARSFDIPVIFTFFAFLPETWGGVNAYLDPRSVNAQKEFILAFVQRYQAVNDLLWDFINEPSFCSPKYLWQCRPNYDAFESSAWSAWLKERYQYPTEEERVSRLQEMYRTTPEDVYSLPGLDEFSDVNIFDDRRPLKVIDYRLFAQEAFAKWVKTMADVVRLNGNPNQLITVGQDEGGTGESPGNHFIADAVDVTSLHNWWLNDDLVWDSIVTKTAGKPNLVEETGVMFYEKMDGSAWRTEEEARNLLERKMAIALGAGGAGFIEWVWNANPYMMSDNEAAIGLHRPDGTAKPERMALERFAKFFSEIREHIDGKAENELLMVIPHSVQYSTRNFATDATKRCVRVVSHFHSLPMTAVSEYKLSSVTTPPKLIIAPSLRAFNENGWQKLLGLVESGSTLLVTGIFDADEHFLPASRGTAMGLTLSSRPVAQEEFLSFNGKEYRLSYRGDKIQRLEVALARGVSPSPEGTHMLQIISRGKGKILWSPLPVELSDPPQANIDLYDLAVKTSGITMPFTVDKVNPSILILPLIFKSTVLLTMVSETDRDNDVHVTATESGAQLTAKLPAQRTALLLFRRSDGKVLAQS